MSLRPDADYEECVDCGARFLLTEVVFPDEDGGREGTSDINTQFGWLAGQCPRCGADLTLEHARVRNAFFRR